jgi:hypothetical protein
MTFLKYEFIRFSSAKIGYQSALVRQGHVSVSRKGSSGIPIANAPHVNCGEHLGCADIKHTGDWY